MSIINEYKNKIVAEINRALGKDLVGFFDLAYPPSLEGDMGDISLPCYSLTKSMGMDPALIAKDLAGKIQSNDVVKSVSNLGPYLNICLANDFYELVINGINQEKDEYGKNNSGNSERVMIEFSNANTHKEYHVGHLRNLSYGDALSRIMKANGYESIPVSYINDFGIHVAKTIWLLNMKHETRNMKQGLGGIYAEASERLKNDEEANAEVKKIMKSIESRQGEYYELWEETRKWSIEEFARIYGELGISFEKIFYESEVIDSGRKIIDELLERGILVHSEGAVIADLKSESLSVLVCIRSDGTATYPVADLGLAVEKFEKFNIDRSLYVVDVRQSLYFKQLFRLLNKMGYDKKMVHLAYDFVKLPDGMMSSRTGNVITYEELREKMMGVIVRATKERHVDWSKEKVTQAANKIVSGAIKFEMLKVGVAQSITFDIEKALSFEGFSSAYLQYTYARMNSIMRKCEMPNTKYQIHLLSHKKERGLILKLAKFGDAISLAGDSYDPSEIAKYLFELGQAVNDYYHEVNILKAEDDVKNARLALLSAVSQVMKNGLGLLGIEVVEEM